MARQVEQFEEFDDTATEQYRQPGVQPQANSTEDSGTPAWVWILIPLAVVIVLAVGGLLAAAPPSDQFGRD